MARCSQYRLSTVLIGVVCVCLLMSYISKEMRHKKAVEWLELKDAVILYDYELDGAPGTESDSFLGLHLSHRVASIEWSDAPIDEPWVEALQSLGGLRELTISSTNISADDLQRVLALKRLTKLRLDECSWPHRRHGRGT